MISCFCAVLYKSLNEIMTGSMSGSVAVSFFATIAFLSQSAAAIGKYMNKNRQSAATSDRLLETHRFLTQNQQPLLRSFEKTTAAKEIAIQCKDLRLTYDKKVILQSFNYEFEFGKIYLLQGVSGSGKTTLLRSLLGVHTPASGDIIWNTQLSLPQTIGYIPQHPTLFPGTLIENIVYPAKKIDLDKIDRILLQVELAKRVEQLPKKLNTHVGYGGWLLSGGEIQRLMWARALYHNFSLIIVDEGISALDPGLEAQTYENIKMLADKGTTVIMASHAFLPLTCPFKRSLYTYDSTYF